MSKQESTKQDKKAQRVKNDATKTKDSAPKIRPFVFGQVQRESIGELTLTALLVPGLLARIQAAKEAPSKKERKKALKELVERGDRFLDGHSVGAWRNYLLSRALELQPLYDAETEDLITEYMIGSLVHGATDLISTVLEEADK